MPLWCKRTHTTFPYIPRRVSWEGRSHDTNLPNNICADSACHRPLTSRSPCAPSEHVASPHVVADVSNTCYDVIISCCGVNVIVVVHLLQCPNRHWVHGVNMWQGLSINGWIGVLDSVDVQGIKWLVITFNPVMAFAEVIVHWEFLSGKTCWKGYKLV